LLIAIHKKQLQLNQLNRRDIIMLKVELKSIKKEECFQLNSESEKWYQKHHFNRSDCTYTCSDLDNINREIYVFNETKVYV